MRKDFESQCEAISRKTNKRCLNKTTVIFPNTIAHEPVMNENQFTIRGEDVCLCHGHTNMFSSKKEVRLIKKCFLKPSNKYGYGSRVSSRGGSVDLDRAHHFLEWGNVELSGNVPEELRDIFKANPPTNKHITPNT